MNTTVIPSPQGENPKPTGEELTITTTSSEVIKVCTPYYEGIPEELKNISQWVVWYNNTNETARGSKQPRHPSSPYVVSALDSNNWFDFHAACETYEKMGVSGVGFTFTKEVGMTTIDVDGCVDYNDVGVGNVNELGQSILDKFANDTYAEISFHLDGIHIVTYGNLPEGEVGGHRKNAAGQQIEMYDCARFIAITGHKVSGCNAHVGHCEAVLAELCEEYKCVVKKRSDKPKNTTVASRPSIGEELGLKCMNIAPPYKSFVRGDEIVGCNPISGHNNTSGTAYNVNPGKNTWYCFAHKCGGDALMLYAMEKGLIDCGEEITDYHELYNELRADGYDLSFLDPTYDPHCGDDLMTTNVDEVKKVEEKPVVKTGIETVPVSLLSIPGILQRGVEYYEATAKYSQPQFAVLTMILLGSTVMGRRFVTDYDNYTSLYGVAVGRSSAGKEFGRSVIEKLLEGADLSDFCMASGFTSSGGVVSALVEHPTQISIIDELGRVLKSSSAEGSSNKLDSHTVIMELFGKLDGRHVPQGYSTMGFTKEKRDEIAARRIIKRPALSLICMSTPETLYDALTKANITDGFLPRFIIVESAIQTRQMLKMRKKSVPIPTDLISWMKTCAATGVEQEGDFAGLETALIPPEAKMIPFSDESMEVLNNYELYIHTMLDKYEKSGVADMFSKSREIAHRISLIVAVSCGSDVIQPEHAEWAVEFVKYYNLKAVERLSIEVVDSKFEKAVNQAYEYIKIHSPCSRRTLFRSCSRLKCCDSNDADKVLLKIVNTFDVLQTTVANPSGGKPTQMFTYTPQ